jgi:hypothetical protein
LTNITFTELATGVGIVDSFAMATEDSTGVLPALQTNQSYLGSVNNLDVRTTDYTFVMNGINKSFSLEGSMKFNFMTSGKTAADSNSKTFNIVITILKNSTTIATATTKTVDVSSNNTPLGFFFSLEKDIPFTRFSKSDELKIKFNWVQLTGGAYQKFDLWIDNANQNVGADADQIAINATINPTVNKIGLPIKL